MRKCGCVVRDQQEGFSRVQTVQKEIFLHTARLLRVHLKSVVVYLTYSKFKICVPIRYMPKYILLFLNLKNFKSKIKYAYAYKIDNNNKSFFLHSHKPQTRLLHVGR